MITTVCLPRADLTEHFPSSEHHQNTVVFNLITRRGNRPHMVPLAVPETVQFAARFMQAEAAEREEKARMKQLVLEMHEAQKEEELEWGLWNLFLTVFFWLSRRRLYIP